jgi:hypothetical protein
LAQDFNGLESTLTRSGDGLMVAAELVNIRPTELRSFLQGRLSASRAPELRAEMLAVGIPLSADRYFPDSPGFSGKSLSYQYC